MQDRWRINEIFFLFPPPSTLTSSRRIITTACSPDAPNMSLTAFATTATFFFFCSDFIDYIKRGFEAIKDIYSTYQIKLHLSSFCCVIVPLNSLHHASSFSLAHEGSWWQ
jgi:hypothetical protein